MMLQQEFRPIPDPWLWS